MNNYFDGYIKAVQNPLPEMKEYFEQENKFLESLISSESSVLDIGCGNGRTLVYLASKIKQGAGIDFDKRMVLAAKENTKTFQNIKIVEGDYREWIFDEKFDLVNASYNFLASPEADVANTENLLRKMISETKEGGYVCFALWIDSPFGMDFAKKYYPSIGFPILDITGSEVVVSIGNVKRFSKKEIDELMSFCDKKYSIRELGGIFYLVCVNC